MLAELSVFAGFWDNLKMRGVMSSVAAQRSTTLAAVL